MLLISMSLMVIPPFFIKIITYPEDKVKLIVSILKYGLSILYGSLSLLLILINITTDYYLEIILFIILSVIIVSNTLFLFIEIIEYYKKKYKDILH